MHGGLSIAAIRPARFPGVLWRESHIKSGYPESSR